MSVIMEIQKIEGIDFFDSSQSNSEVINDAKSEFPDLVNLGFGVIGIMIGEFYQDLANKIPMEYAIHPVDDRVDIYSEYSDDIYDKFIEEGKNVHKKFNNIDINNEKENCNSKNNKLFLYDNSCLNIETNTHGGHKCINNKWDMSQCVPSFCDIGFFFNQSSQMCEEECRFDLIKSYFIFEDNYDNTFILKKDIYYQFALTLPKRHYIYFYQCSENLINDYPRVGFIKEYLYVNELRKANKDFNLRIKGFEPSIDYEIFSINDLLILDSIYSSKRMIIFEIDEDYIIYLRDTLNKNHKYKLAIYDDKMTFDDINNINSIYFKEYKDELNILKKNNIYIIYFDYNKEQQYHIYLDIKSILQPVPIIKINDDDNFLYLEKGDYDLDLTQINNKIKPMLHLSRKTLNSEIVVFLMNAKKIIYLNSNNLYYKIPDNEQKIKITVKNENAFLEFHYTQENKNLYKLEYSESKIFQATQKYNLIYIPQIKYKNRVIKLSLTSNKNLNFTIYAGYSIPPYAYYKKQDNGFGYSKKEVNIEITEHKNSDDITLMKDEYYCIMIEKFDDLTISLRDDYFSGLKDWLIIVICVVVAVVVVVVVVVYFIAKKLKEKCNNDTDKKKSRNEEPPEDKTDLGEKLQPGNEQKTGRESQHGDEQEQGQVEMINTIKIHEIIN